jgi:outer membrane protein assembly factor BamB
MTAPAVDGRLVLSSWGPCLETSGGATGAFRIAHGAGAWVGGLDGDHSSVTISDGVAYVVANGIPVYQESPRVEAFDVADGTLRWSAELGSGSLASPAVGGDRAYVLAGATLFALSTDDGSVAWSADVSDLLGSPASLGQVTIARGRVLVALDQGVAAFDPGDGSRLWASPSGLANGIAVGGRTAYVTGDRLVALRIGTGTIRWSRALGSPFAPSVAGDLVWLGNERVHAVDRTTGQRVWVSPPVRAARHGAPFTTPVVVGDTVYAAIRTSVFAWRLPSG